MCFFFFAFTLCMFGLRIYWRHFKRQSLFMVCLCCLLVQEAAAFIYIYICARKIEKQAEWSGFQATHEVHKTWKYMKVLIKSSVVFLWSHSAKRQITCCYRYMVNHSCRWNEFNSAAKFSSSWEKFYPPAIKLQQRVTEDGCRRLLIPSPQLPISLLAPASGWLTSHLANEFANMWIYQGF